MLGTIANEIEGDDDDLTLRFSFALVVVGVEGGSAAEQEYADSMTGNYLKAVAATLNAMRRLATSSTIDEQARVVEAMGAPGKYAKLGRLKAQYDPESLFRMNYNISPAQ